MASVLIDRPALNLLRGALAVTRFDRIDRLFELEDATNAFKEAKRLFTPTDTEYIAADERQRQAVAGLAATRTNEATAYQALQDGLRTWLIDVAREDFITVDDDIARLDQRFPIVMFPVRIETRFDALKLRVRVFPDEIFLNRHETALTVAERDAAMKYYNDLNTLGDEEERWRAIIQQFGPERSAYILRAMRPTGFTTTAQTPCGEHIEGHGHVNLTFPTDVKLRAGSWTRPGEAVLPDRWVVVTYRNGFRKVFVGSRIVEPLAMTTDPGLPDDQMTPIATDQTYKIDDKIKWTVDFERAKEVGMGIEIGLDPLEAAPITGGFDRVIVFGVKTSYEKEVTTQHFLNLLDAHHYTRGLAFVRQGTPTNNTADSPTPFPPDDEDGKRSFEIERQAAPTASPVTDCLPFDSDGARFASALGIPNGVFANIDRAKETEIKNAIAMNTALWPLTYGYFMKVLMAGIFSDTTIGFVKDYVSLFIRPRGVAPAFRIGTTPYGVLPATSIYRWKPFPLDGEAGDAITAQIIDPLRRLIPIWLDASVDVPRVTGNATDPDVELMTILSTFPSAKEIRVRHGVGGITWYNIFNFLGWNFTLVNQRLNSLTEALFRRIGHPEWRPRIGNVIFDSRAWRLVFPLVSDKPLEVGVPATQAFIAGIRDATVQQLKDNTFPGVPANFSFLFSLLRHATLAEYARITNEFFLAVLQKWTEPEFYRFPSQLPMPPSIVESALAQLASAFDAKIAPHKSALSTLALASDAELDRLLGETLDFASHRLDAWVTGVASQRLTAMRFRNGGGQYFGGYAWVENLRPVTRTTQTVDNVLYETQPNTGGYIHTPSMTHAATAAILRSAHISSKREDPAKFAIDLSSRRVRNARKVLDEIRAGQPLGAILGYRFERGLHEGHPDVPGLDLDKIRFALRNLFPLVAGKNGVDTTELAENVAARNVVDGLTLIQADRNNQIDFAHDPNLPRPGTNQYNAVKAEIDKLKELHDAVADLLMAESVYQLARGNLTGAVAPLDNVTVGRPPPEPGVAHSVRTGVGLTQRVALVFPTDPIPPLPDHWPTTPTPRALGEPVLDAWLGRVLGDPSKVTCTVKFDQSPGSATVALSDLALRPLDVLALARVALEKGLASVLDARVLTAALGTDTTKTNVSIDYDPGPNRDPKTDRTFPEVFEVARALGAALGAARPLDISDLASPSEVEKVVADAEATALTDVLNVEARADTSANALKEVTNSTTVSADRSLARALQIANPANPTPTELQNLRSALTIAANFAPERAFPPRTASAKQLISLAKAVRTELTRRITAVDNLGSAPALAKDRAQRAIDILKAVFGADFVALPTLHVPRPDEIDESFDSRVDLVGQDDSALSRYFQQATRARANLRRFHKFSIYSRALGQPPLSLNLAQLPRVPGEPWLGRKLDSFQPKEGRAATIFLSEEATPDTGGIWAGLVLEQWSEVIPKTEEQTAVAFHFDTPRAAAPQAVLLAIPSDLNVAWQAEDLIATLNETLDLAKVRAVDAELVPLGQTLPLAMVAQNDALDVTFATLYSVFVGAPSIEAFQGFT